MNSHPVVNAAHGSGYTCLTFSPDGLLASFPYIIRARSIDVLPSLTYTGGTDSIVRIWKSQQGADQDPPIAIDATESISSITVSVSFFDMNIVFTI
jgi:chromosome transmission fidelity protein 4